MLKLSRKSLIICIHIENARYKKSLIICIHIGNAQVIKKSLIISIHRPIGNAQVIKKSLIICIHIYVYTYMYTYICIHIGNPRNDAERPRYNQQENRTNNEH